MAAAEKANKHKGFLARATMRLYGIHLTSKKLAQFHNES